jgi:hypothetical protein
MAGKQRQTKMVLKLRPVVKCCGDKACRVAEAVRQIGVTQQTYTVGVANMVV